MDETRFDRITKSLAAGTSRRSLVTMLTAGLTGGAIASLVGDESAAGKNGDRERRDQDGGDKRARRKKRRGRGSKGPTPVFGNCITNNALDECECINAGAICAPLGTCAGVVSGGQCINENERCRCV